MNLIQKLAQQFGYEGREGDLIAELKAIVAGTAKWAETAADAAAHIAEDVVKVVEPAPVPPAEFNADAAATTAAEHEKTPGA